MCTDLHGVRFNVDFDLALFYLVRPLGWNGAPGNFAIFGDAISAMHSHMGNGEARLVLLTPPISRLYIDGGLFSEVESRIQQIPSTTAWGSIAKGHLGRRSINSDKLEEEGICGPKRTMLGFAIDSNSVGIRLLEARVAGALSLFDQLQEKAYSISIGVNTPHQVRGHIEHCIASNSMWKLVTGPIDTMLRFTDECAIRANCLVFDVRQAFWRSMDVIITCMMADGWWRQCFQGKPDRLLKPEKRHPVALSRISSISQPDDFVRASVDAKLGYVGGVSCLGGPGDLSLPQNRIEGHGTRVIRRCAPNRGMRVDGRGYHGHLLGPQGVPEYTSAYRKPERSFLGFPGAPPLPFAQSVATTSMSVSPNVWGGYPPVYIRSGRNFIADNLTRCGEAEAEQWPNQEEMCHVDDAIALWSSTGLPYNASPLIANRPNTFATHSLALCLFINYSRRVCER